jgi:hypothetical protein
VLGIKHESITERLKARFVLGGHRDREKKSLINNSTTMTHQSVCLILALSSVFGFDLWSSDFNQAYLQSAEQLQRDIFIYPDKLIAAPKNYYNLYYTIRYTESGGYWVKTLTEHHTNDLGMTQTKRDFSLFFKHATSKLLGLSGAFVEDLLRAGTLRFNDSSQRTTENRFDVKPLTTNEFTFAGFYITTHGERSEISQNDYFRRLKLVSSTCEFAAK